MNFYKEEAVSVVTYFESSQRSGLNNSQIIERQKSAKSKATRKSNFKIFFRLLISNTKAALNPIAKILAVTMLILNMAPSAKTVATIAFLAAIIMSIYSFIKEYKNNMLLRSAKEYCPVLRDSQSKTVEIKELVPGDIIILEPGVKIHTQARIIECVDLEIDESILNGEQIAVKKTNARMAHDARIHDQYNMLFKDTVVVDGYGKAVVTQQYHTI